MLDSESRLREAVQKMLEVRQTGGTDTTPDDDLDMSGLSMDDELDMSGISMEDADTSSPQ
jgi:Cu(I)/Ag(I) efflux system membrane fusion protein/cobalt-zinc-cadmium efflux system membrane fusion protein